VTVLKRFLSQGILVILGFIWPKLKDFLNYLEVKRWLYGNKQGSGVISRKLEGIICCNKSALWY